MGEQSYEAYAASWARGPLVGFDTETTGVDVTHDRIVTAAVVLRIPGVSTDVRTWLLDPGVEIPAEAAAIHGVTTQHARAHGAPAAVALEEIAAELTAHLREGVPVVAYNAAFDLSLLDAELARHGLATLPQRLGHAVTPVLDPLVIDRWQDRYRRGKRRLGDLVAHYGVQTADSLHAADVDVLATLDVLDSLLRHFPRLADLTLEQLHEAQVGAHHAWALTFNEWRAGKGLEGPGASTAWPVEPARS
ncbi:DNA polymerase III subunit epsilon [Xylanimonas allomyrinae]|uniref:DNA polymerase III subunit epsilon n=1 Tax=Xylanimonas allomyrinae TaxID=2509459 RepID=A0A4P6F2B0_9MICO|nr:exonuclease domain-containing protein [Xylanimonas allomyrinae]QAY64488.1 DNA polymerase III subunit epsilon [Xylanimonas allomyrinae]